jgi:hypothetical protein
MTHTALTRLIGVEYDKFLCAPIGEDRNGTTLTRIIRLGLADVA